ncbi:MAG: transposase [Proteobacteria bacterium]|nr:transposase [Pseudomonadota bacterium]
MDTTAIGSFPLLSAAYDLKERYFKIWDLETKEEALAEYLNWEASIPLELAKAFKPIPVAWRTWRKYILNYFDDKRITNAFTESFNAKIRRAYRNGHGYSFEVLRAKVLFSDAMQKKVRIAEQVKVKRKQRFEEISLARVACFDLVASFDEPEYDIKTVRRIATLGTYLPTLLDEIDRWPI